TQPPPCGLARATTRRLSRERARGRLDFRRESTPFSERPLLHLRSFPAQTASRPGPRADAAASGQLADISLRGFGGIARRILPPLRSVPESTTALPYYSGRTRHSDPRHGRDRKRPPGKACFLRGLIVPWRPAPPRSRSAARIRRHLTHSHLRP